MRNRYIALIPAYRPDAKLISLTDELAEKGFDIVIVDDGSGEAFREIFDQVSLNATVLTHPDNRGKGAALKTGMRYISKYMAYCETVMTENGAVSVSGKEAVIVTVDADGQHLPEDVLRISRIAEMHNGSLVLGSRELKENVPARSKFGNTVTRHVYSLATGVRIHDTQTGLRAFRRSLIPALLEIEGERYEYEINVLLKLAAEGIPIIEEDIETVYENDNRGSHFDTLRDSFRIYREILKFSASSLVSFAIDYSMYAFLLVITAAAGMTEGLIISNIGARLVSGAANYTMNRKLVFRSGAAIGRSAAQYILLAGCILAGNTVLLSTLVETMGMSSMIAKLITEAVFFAVSWTVQRYVIFYRDTETDAGSKCLQREAAVRSGEY